MYLVGPGSRFPLCLSCYVIWRAADIKQTEEEERYNNFVAEEFEIIAGMKGLTPRFPPRWRASIVLPGGVSLHNIRISNSEIGFLNAGTIGHIDAAVTVIRERGSERLAQAVSELSEAVIKSDGVSATAKKKFLELLEAAMTEVVAPKEKRRLSLIRTLAAEITALLSGVSTLAKLWEQARGLIEQLIGR
jgi:hypothetical protein